MPLDNVVFWVFAPISVASAIGLLAMRNAVHAALFLVVNFFTLAVMFLLLDAPFLFAVQIVVYAGAIPATTARRPPALLRRSRAPVAARAIAPSSGSRPRASPTTSRSRT